MSLASFLALIVVGAPVVGALLAASQRGGGHPRLAMWAATVCVLVSAIAALWLFVLHVTVGPLDQTVTLARWIEVGSFTANWAIRIDAPTVVMMVVVTGVSALVHLYSFGYMASDPHRSIFYSFLSFFTVAMLILVCADNFLQMFVGWEGVGLASYLLIGFWRRKTSANDAAIKAFVTNRVGDAGLIIGLALVYIVFGSLEFESVFSSIASHETLTPLAYFAPSSADQMAIGQIRALDVIGVFLFIGAMGKSAQIVLHVWLPDAMEGPTPVSALIHAATMVTAGVFLVCRCAPIYSSAPVAATLVAGIGAATALFAATIALVQNDIKRVIAWSTCSQLGYMFVAAGLGAYAASMFHLFTHAFFKALLFLGAGAVIHGFNHEQDMRRMGGLRGKMPYVWVMMLIGTLALTGIGFPGSWLGFAGFFSKDAIIETAWLADTGVGKAAFLSGLIAAGMTSFYSWRLMLMTFHGPKASDWSLYEHAHDPPQVMKVPLAVLALGAVIAGAVFAPYFLGVHLGDVNVHFWGDAFGAGHGAGHGGGGDEQGHHAVPGWVIWSPLVVSVVGFVVAVYLYGVDAGAAVRMSGGRGPLYRFLSGKWYFDWLYGVVFVRGVAWIGDVLKGSDTGLIDRVGPDGMASLALGGARRVSIVHTGHIYTYAFVMLAAIAVIGAYTLVRG